MSTKNKSTRTRAAIALSAVALVGVGGIASTASFNDTATVTATADAGEVSFDINGTAEVELENISSTKFTPGTTVSDTFTVNYTGTNFGRAVFTPEVSGELADYIEVTITDDRGTTYYPTPWDEDGKIVLSELGEWDTNFFGDESVEGEYADEDYAESVTYTVTYRLVEDVPAGTGDTADLRINAVIDRMPYPL